MGDELIHLICDDEFYRTVFQTLYFMDRHSVSNLKRNDGACSTPVIILIGAFNFIDAKAYNAILGIWSIKHFQLHKSGIGGIDGGVQLNIKYNA